MNGFRHLDVSLEFENTSSPKVNKDTFKSCILFGIETIFGEFGTCIPIDIVKYQDSIGRGTLRCPESFYKKLRAALTLTGEYQKQNCCFTVHEVLREKQLHFEN